MTPLLSLCQAILEHMLGGVLSSGNKALGLPYLHFALSPLRTFLGEDFERGVNSHAGSVLDP